MIHACLEISDYHHYCVSKCVFMLLIVLLQFFCVQQDFFGFEQLFSGTRARVTN